MMTTGWDAFLSYRTRCEPEVAPLVAALAGAGVRVWRDEERIDEGASVGEGVRGGIDGSRAMLCWASLDYPQSRVCQWEMAAAWVAAEMDGTVDARVLVLLPPGVRDPAHLPSVVRDRKAWRVPADEPELQAFAARIAVHLGSLSPRRLGELASVRRRPPWLLRKEAIPSGRFVGRTDALWRLHSLVQADKLTVVTGKWGEGGPAQVRGLGGNGKTLLAIEYIARFGAAFPGGVFWVDVAGRQPEDAFGDVAVALGLSTDHPEEVRASLLGRGRYLWVADNVPARVSRREAEAWCAPTPNGRTLVTTRSRTWADMGGELDLGVLEPDEARLLLCRERAPTSTAEEEAATLLCRDVGFHPLTVDVLRALLRDSSSRTPYVQWRRRLAEPTEDALRLGEHLAEELPTGIAKYVGVVLDSSFRALRAEAIDLLLLANSMADSPIPSQLAEEVLAALGAANAEARVFAGLQDGRAQGLIDPGDGGSYSVHALVRRVLSFKDRPVGRPSLRWRMDRLVREFLRVDQPTRAFDLRTAAVKTLPAWFKGADDIRNHGTMLAILPHVEHLSAPGTSVPEVWLGSLAAHFLDVRGEYAAARRGCNRALEGATRLLGPEHPLTLGMLHNLAVTLVRNDVAAAQGHLTRCLEARTRLAGAEHPDTLDTLEALAVTLRDQGDLTGAREHLEQVLQARTRLLGGEHPSVLRAMDNLASTLAAQRDLAGARALGERALAAKTRTLGPEHPSTLHTSLTLGDILHEEGETARASALSESALEAQARLLGPEHPETINSLANRATRLQEQGDLAGARALQERVLEATTRLLGPEDPATLAACNNLAVTLEAQGDHSGARGLLKRALEDVVPRLGHEHPHSLSLLSSLANTLYRVGDVAGSREILERLLDVRTRLFGPEHPATLSASTNLAVALQAQGDLAAARSLYESTIEAMIRGLGPLHPITLSAMLNLAITLVAQGELQAGRDLSEHVLVARTRLLGPEHPDTLTAAHFLSIAFIALGDLATGHDLLNRVLGVRARVLGPAHPDTLVTLRYLKLAARPGVQDLAAGDRGQPAQPSGPPPDERDLVVGEHEEPNSLSALENMAIGLASEGDFAGARSHYERALRYVMQDLGPEHPHTLHVLRNLAITARMQGDLVGAQRFAERALDGSTKLFGGEHPDTFESSEVLASALHAQGDLAAVADLLERTVAARIRVLGPGHEATLRTRLNLVVTLLARGELARAEVHVAGLGSVRGKDPSSLSGVDREVLGHLPSFEALYRLVRPT